MCRWMQAIGELAAPLLALMKRRMLEHSVISPVPCLRRAVSTLTQHG